MYCKPYKIVYNNRVQKVRKENENMNERKILDFEMEKGKNISVFYVNAETDDPTLVFIEKEFGNYFTFASDNTIDLVQSFFDDDQWVSKINYISPDTIELLKKEEELECINEVRQICLLNHLNEYLERLIKEEI